MKRKIVGSPGLELLKLKTAIRAHKEMGPAMFGSLLLRSFPGMTGTSTADG